MAEHITEVKKRKRTPSIKQQKALANLVENGGNVSRAMLDAGYSPATAKTPQKLTESDAVIQLMEEMGITNSFMLETLRDGLRAEKVVIVGNGEEAMADVQPDHQNRHKFLETAIKLKGLARGTDPTNPTVNFINMIGSQKSKYNI